MSEDAERIWRLARNSSVAADRAQTRSDWLQDLNQNNIVTSWALGLEPLPVYANDSSILDHLADSHLKFAKDLQDRVACQTKLSAINPWQTSCLRL